MEGVESMSDTNLGNHYSFAIKYRLYCLHRTYRKTISNKESLAPHEYKAEPEYNKNGWYRGYGFKHFWSNCHFLLGDLAALDGMQQLCHQYYLQNGSLGAPITVARIKHFLGFSI